MKQTGALKTIHRNFIPNLQWSEVTHQNFLPAYSHPENGYQNFASVSGYSKAVGKVYVYYTVSLVIEKIETTQKVKIFSWTKN